MDLTEGHEINLRKLKEDGSIKNNELSEIMNVSGVTVRKDLKLLEGKQLLFWYNPGLKPDLDSYPIEYDL